MSKERQCSDGSYYSMCALKILVLLSPVPAKNLASLVLPWRKSGLRSHLFVTVFAEALQTLCTFFKFTVAVACSFLCLGSARDVTRFSKGQVLFRDLI